MATVVASDVGSGSRSWGARAPSPSSAYWREEEGDREEEVGWACQLGRQGGLGRVG